MVPSRHATKGYPRSWYPIARSSELKGGQHQAIRAFSADWILFRGISGEAGFLRRHCPHMGADLVQGGVNENSIECPLHGWRFSRMGVCDHIPALKKSLPHIETKSLPCYESYGIIFVFWGENPEYELPLPPQMEGDLICSHVHTIELETEHHTPCLNTFDLQHFERIHNRRFVERPKIFSQYGVHLQIEYKAAIIKRRWSDYIMAWIGPSNTRVVIDCWGSSLLMLYNRDTKIGGMVAMLPIEHNQSRVFILAAKEEHGKRSIIRGFLDQITVGLGAFLMKGFLQPDLSALTNMQPYDGKLIDGLDDAAQLYWDYWQQLPRWAGPLTPQGD
ncbi:MAG: Rieske 2Fe-2S domain-containing protein [Candidatus Thiodiazotropha sp. (ex Lucinoma borealis)]|nr:Rieske 2Fe-2S domain-containing protein [Candidatus Thiodiazotropha sp. (ex Lucinoma borealis)]